MTSLLKKNWFVLGIFLAVVLAFQIPEWGAKGGRLHSEITTELGILMVFFFQGWMLPSEILLKSLIRWRIHLYIQLFIFAVFPLLVIGGNFLWGPHVPDALRTGLFFLGVLPTTITSAVIYTSQSGGNTAIALANTTISNLAGVVLAPLWIIFLVSSGGDAMGDLGAVFLKLSKLILLPFFLGQIAHLFWKSVLPRIKKPAQYLNQAVILFIVFAAFSNSMMGGVWNGQGPTILLSTILICLFLFVLVYFLNAWGNRFFQFSMEDRPAIYYCSTQKTLATAVPLGISLFGTDPAFGIILLPVMVYHLIQLFVGAFFFQRFRDQIESSSGA
jgi:solute carrier family 10 (sodium/bile acid cotransporter), member 7